MDKVGRQRRASVGICIKAMDRTVLEQNSVCVEFCGARVGSQCHEGCMQRIPATSPSAAPTLGFHVEPNLCAGEQVFDALLIDDGDTLTTILLPKAKFVSRMRALFDGHGLSPAEVAVIELVLQGHPNREIAQRLFVTRQTLKTHLNNINKKLPTVLSVESLRRRLRLEI